MVKPRQPHLLKGVDLFLMEVVAIQHPRSPAQIVKEAQCLLHEILEV